MAITINTQITGQVASATPSYCYLYEPLYVGIFESESTALKLYVDLEIQDTNNSANVVETIVRYGNFDLNPGQKFSLDLMKLAQQYHQARLYNYSHIDDIVEDTVGWYSAVSRYRYNFKIYTDVTTTPISIVKIPIIGGRTYTDFEAAVNEQNPLTELDVFGISLSNRWKGYPYITNALADPTIVDAKPSLIKVISTGGKIPCGGQLIWKSKLGGWVTWGFDSKDKRTSHSYEGRIEVGPFEPISIDGGNAFVEADYTGITTRDSISLKAFSLTNAELQAANGITSSPAIYYMKDNSGRLELMRLTSASVPQNSLANGGDFSVSLRSISSSSQRTR
jgi:hypothetical protein